MSSSNIELILIHDNCNTVSINAPRTLERAISPPPFITVHKGVKYSILNFGSFKF